MVHRQGKAVLDVDRHGRLAPGGVAKENARAPGLDGEVGAAAPPHFRPDKKPVHRPLQEGLLQTVFVVCIVRSVAGKNKFVAQQTKAFFQLQRQQGKKWVLQIASHQPHRVALANAQTSGCPVAHISQTTRRFFDAQAGLRAESGISRGIIENAGSGCGMHIGLSRYIFQIRHSNPTTHCGPITQPTNHESH